jgi:hypothetical protein
VGRNKQKEIEKILYSPYGVDENKKEFTQHSTCGGWK